jgi:HK97 family phage major capsid protein
MVLLAKQSVLLGKMTMRPMTSPEAEIDKLSFEGRVLRRGTSQVALGTTERVKPTLGKTTLATKLFKAEARIGTETLDDNIEGDRFKDLVMQEMTKAAGRDMEELVIQGDTSSTDTFLASLDGLLKQATSHVVDAGGVRLGKDTLKNLQKALPNEYLAQKPSMGYFTSTLAEIDYRDGLADRVGALGDVQFSTETTVGYTGIPVVPVPLFPDDLGDDDDSTSVLFMDPKNAHIGIQRQITVEWDRDVSAGELIIVISLRFDTKFAHEPAVAKAINVLTAS